ncbi:MAG: glycosyltransferase family 2 protein [Candidatus Omnitrophica bacterium]|nr:glycosyltransferase family 2 protein [Candidatus Omnitrophota bacterium]
MTDGSKFLIIIPAYNEAENIPSLIEEIRGYFPTENILIVDDGSSDRTRDAARVSNVKVITLPFNLGYGDALQTGYKYALRNGYDFVVQMDGDGQHDPAYISSLLDTVRKGDADIVLGSRFLGESGGYKMGILRRTGILLFSAITSIATRQKITDPTSGFQVINKKVFSFYASDIYPSDFPDADVIILSKFYGFRIKEISVKMRESKAKKSMHSGLKPIYYVFKMFLSILVTILRNFLRKILEKK